jgi:hypothetical protein
MTCPPRELIRSKAYRTFLDKALGKAFAAMVSKLAVIAHSRLVTNGTRRTTSTTSLASRMAS